MSDDSLSELRDKLVSEREELINSETFKTYFSILEDYKIPDSIVDDYYKRVSPRLEEISDRLVLITEVTVIEAERIIARHQRQN